MKRLKLFALGLISVSALTFTSCSDDEEDPVGPILTVTENNFGISGGEIDATVGADLDFQWDARKGDVDLNEFSISVDGAALAGPTDDGNNLPYSISNADDENYMDGITVNVGMNPGIRTYTFTVTDDDGLNDRVTVTVNITTATTPLGTEVNGAFFHVGGSLEGAYDLVNDGVVAASGNEADKDMKNTDMAGDPFTGSWEAGAGNGTTFVLDNSYDYANASVETAAAAYAAGTATNQVNNPSDGDIYIARLRGGSDFAVIKIANVDPTDNTCSCLNLGKITFDYKKE